MQGVVTLRGRDGGVNAGKGAAGGLGFACRANAVAGTERPVGASVPTPVRGQEPGRGLVLADGHPTCHWVEAGTGSGPIWETCPGQAAATPRNSKWGWAWGMCFGCGWARSGLEAAS